METSACIVEWYTVSLQLFKTSFFGAQCAFSCLLVYMLYFFVCLFLLYLLGHTPYILYCCVDNFLISFLGHNFFWYSYSERFGVSLFLICSCCALLAWKYMVLHISCSMRYITRLEEFPLWCNLLYLLVLLVGSDSVHMIILLNVFFLILSPFLFLFTWFQ